MDAEKKNTKINEVRNFISDFAKENLTKEEEGICIRILEKLSRKKKIDITRTKSDIWAASVIWAFCRANFKSEEGITMDLVSSFFDVKKSTFGNKAGELCKMFKIDFFNPEYTSQKIQESNPLNDVVMTNEGFIVPKDMFSQSPTDNKKTTKKNKDENQKLLF
ncbi:conserved hypothetical protein [groundwater metagenome]|uniref:DUF6398 domain-containing protein n=1 Tax=groundwater metagenome TaxID=717931 RepID=A0A098EDQ5_9ZZZZ